MTDRQCARQQRWYGSCAELGSTGRIVRGQSAYIKQYIAVRPIIYQDKGSRKIADVIVAGVGV